MTMLLRVALLLWFALAVPTALAEARVFNLVTPNPDKVVEGVRALYGDKLQVDLVQQRLVVIGTPQQLNEVGTLLAQLDRAPVPLRLMVREQPPAADDATGTTYSTERGSFSVDTVEQARVVLDYSEITQRPAGNGWAVYIEDVPVEFSSLMLQLQLRGSNSVEVQVSYSRLLNQQRKVYGNTVVGELGTWIPLLPRPHPEAADGTISSGAKPGSQLYVRVDKIKSAPARTTAR
jgi:hypothetical protein